MAAAKQNEYAKGKGAVQTGQRPQPEYYSVYGIRFREEEPEGREFQAFLQQEGLSLREFIVRWMRYNEIVQRNILECKEKHS